MTEELALDDTSQFESALLDRLAPIESLAEVAFDACAVYEVLAWEGLVRQPNTSTRR